jgi:excinuclease ABC subunit C
VQRFRVLKPSSKAIAGALESALGLPEPPKRIESFDISHIQGSDTVASMVVWEDGKMKKSDYRKFIIRGSGMSPGPDKTDGLLRDDFASMREAVERRYRRLQSEQKPLPSLILIDGGIGQLHAAAEALDELQIINQPMASIAKKEEILYVLGREGEPIVLDHHSPVLHLIQQIRDETHRSAVTFHRQRRSSRRIRTSLTEIPGVGDRTAQKLLRRFGSVTRLRQLSVEELAAELPRNQAQRVFDALQQGSI